MTIEVLGGANEWGALVLFTQHFHFGLYFLSNINMVESVACFYMLEVRLESFKTW